MNKLGINWRYGIMGIGLLALVLLVRDFNSRMADLRRLTHEYDKVSAQVTSAVATRSVLETQEAYAQTDQAVEEWAYSEGGMGRPGDHMVYPLESPGQTASPEPAEVAVPQEISNWQLWMALFVDSPASQ